MFFCAISGEAPQDAVVSAKSGHVYERRLITKYIAENGTDPVTGEKLEESDLVSVKASPNSAPPRPPNLTSIPALLHTLQNEWDALVLETFALKQQYQATRQELSHALYQQDAATRVVARLIRERDSAREALAEVHASMGVAPPENGSADVEMDTTSEEPLSLPADLVKQINDTQNSLMAARKQRKQLTGYATAADLKAYTVKDTISSLHSASSPGINSLVISCEQPSLFLTGGNDNVVQLYDRSANKIVSTLKGHTSRVNQVNFREKSGEATLVVSASVDKTSRIWAHDSASGEYAPQHTVKTHKGEVTGLAIHPTQVILGLSSSDKTFSLHNLATSQQLYRSAMSDEPFASISVHPDGSFYALGTSTGSIQIYDSRSGSTLSTLELDGGRGFSVNTTSFSENGYHLMAPASNSTVAVWDLRKLKTATTIDLGDFKINKLAYDPSAQFLGVAGSGGALVFAHKTWERVAAYGDSELTDVAWGASSKEVWGVGGRTVQVWA